MLKRGGGGSPKLNVKFWWPLFLAKKFTFLFLNLAKIHKFIPICAEGGSTGLGHIPKIIFFYLFPICTKCVKLRKDINFRVVFYNYDTMKQIPRPPVVTAVRNLMYI